MAKFKVGDMIEHIDDDPGREAREVVELSDMEYTLRYSSGTLCYFPVNLIDVYFRRKYLFKERM